MIQGFVKDVVYSMSNGIPTMSRKYGLDEYFLNRFLNDDRNAFKVSSSTIRILNVYVFRS